MAYAVGQALSSCWQCQSVSICKLALHMFCKLIKRSATHLLYNAPVTSAFLVILSLYSCAMCMQLLCPQKHAPVLLSKKCVMKDVILKAGYACTSIQPIDSIGMSAVLPFKAFASCVLPNVLNNISACTCCDR